MIGSTRMLAPEMSPEYGNLLTVALLWFGAWCLCFGVGLVWWFVCLLKPIDWKPKVRRSLALANLVLTLPLIVLFIGAGAFDAETVLIGAGGLIVAAMLGVPTMGGPKSSTRLGGPR